MEFPYSPETLASITGGKLVSYGTRHAPVRDFLIDSRKLGNPSETIFVALRSNRNDGHKYIAELYEKGVRNFLVSDLPAHLTPEHSPFGAGAGGGVGIILVPDTLVALQAISAHHRSQFNGPVIGITGSNGKTIVKEWLFQLMSKDKNIIRSPKSYNSQIGVPLSVLKIEPYHELAIIEAGISEPGEMSRLEAIIHPTIGIFTNIGQAHNENFSGEEQKIREKLILFRTSDVLIYCKDHRNLSGTLTGSNEFQGIRTFTWGKDATSDLVILNIKKLANLTTILAQYGDSGQSISIPFTDDASIENAIHCWATLLVLGYGKDMIRERMALLAPIAMRLELKEGINRCSIINDSYNSDINSLGIAIGFLNQQNQHERKTVILSDILQSGKDKGELYAEIAGILAGAGIPRIIGIGEDISGQSDKFSGEKAFFRSTDDFLSHYPIAGFHDETILLKGARIFEFERISKLLEQKVHETVLEINLDALVHNLNHYRSKLAPGTKTMAMVKAFSYGSGSYEIANLLQFHNVDYLAVAYADEGVELRKAGIVLPIMVMNPEERSFDLLFRYDLDSEIYNMRGLHLLKDAIIANQKIIREDINIHIKLDTGMHRLGFAADELDELLAQLAGQPQIMIRSVFSHLAASENPEHDAFSRYQISQFGEMSEKIVGVAHQPVLRHILNSAGIIRFPEAQMEMVRLGIGLYGVGFDAIEQSRLHNVSTLKSIISQIKTVKKSDTVGYERKGTLTRDSVIGIVPIGYADGLSRRLSNGRGQLFVHGNPAPVIGLISMDTCAIDLTDIVNSPGGGKLNEGDEVIVFGDDYLLSRMATDLETIPYEILTGISRRVKRVYYHE